jgi:hypothetical protein
VGVTAKMCPVRLVAPDPLHRGLPLAWLGPILDKQEFLGLGGPIWEGSILVSSYWEGSILDHGNLYA